MNLLLDTHAFLCLVSAPNKLSKAAIDACRDSGNTLFLSVVSLWEMQVKHQLGKLQLDLPLAQIVHEQTEGGPFRLLPIHAQHVLTLDQLPLYHSDPFDRLLIAQALVENARFVTADRTMSRYAGRVELLW